ncbi:MAG: hypothetical protein AMS20_14985 [Gemmatimonas sp. SG8_28]|nr:MAG: hypothetical protein AMS20_14985 [Gemmatimonas sp. SG8_28]
MRSGLIALMGAVLFGTPALAQEQTLVSGGLESGGFGAPVVRFSQVNGQFAVLAGGRGGWIINHTFVIGAAGYGVATDVQVAGNPNRRGLEFGYGGVDLEVVIGSDALIHATAQALIGGGAFVLNYGGPTDGVFVFEPGLNVDLNVTPFMRLGLGGGYRWVTDVDLIGFSDSDFSSFFGSVVLKFGSF